MEFLKDVVHGVLLRASPNNEYSQRSFAKLDKTTSQDDDPQSEMSHANHFEFSRTVKELVFEPIRISSVGGILAACVVVMTVAISYELIRLLRKYLIFRSIEEDRRRSMTDVSETRPLQNGIRDDRLNCSVDNWIQSGLHMTQMFIGYILMLSVMTYNAWILLAVLAGAAVGYHFLDGQYWSSRKAAQFEVRLNTSSMMAAATSSSSSSTSNIQANNYRVGGTDSRQQ